MIKVVVGNFNSRIVGADATTLHFLRSSLKYENDIHVRRMMAQKIYGDSSRFNSIERYVYMVSLKGVFLTGLLTKVLALLKKSGDEFEIEDQREPLVLKEDFIARQLDRLPIWPRDYQVDAIFDCLEAGRGIIHAATGAGKTVILSVLAFVYDSPTLIVVERIDLAKQLMEEITEYTGETDVGLIGSGIFKPGKITVGMVQSLQVKGSTSNKSGKAYKLKEFLQSVKVVIVDEAHHVQATSYQNVLANCSNAYARFGCTATPWTSKIVGEEYKESNKEIELEAFLGPLVYKKTTRDLIAEGYLAEPTIFIVQNEVYNDGVRLDYNTEYERIIMEDKQRNDAVCKIIASAFKRRERVIGFVRRIDHGEEIAARLHNEYGVPKDKFAFVNGMLDKETRKSYIEKFKTGELQILFGTVLKEGLNFKCDVGINMAAGETAIDAIQRLGRVLRKSKNPQTGDVDLDVKENVKYYDFADNKHPWFSKHAAKRITTYIQEGHRIVYLPHDSLGEDL